MPTIIEFPGPPGSVDAVVLRQNGMTETEDEENERLVKAALQEMFGPPGQETRTHWADGSAKMPEELEIGFTTKKKEPAKSTPTAEVIKHLDAINDRLAAIEKRVSVQ